MSEDLTDFNLANGDEMSIAGGKNRYALFGLFIVWIMTIKIDIYLNLADAMMVVHGLPGDIAMAFSFSFCRVEN